jgi:hypothetical protein
MKYIWIIFLVLAILLSSTKESFEIHIKASPPSLNIGSNITSAIEGIQNYTTRPLYKKIHSIIPYKHVYRKLRRNIF